MLNPRFFIYHTISNILFCMITMILLGIIMFKTGFLEYELMSNIAMLLTGIYSGYSSSNRLETKKLLKSFAVSGVFLMLYLLTSLLLNNGEIGIFAEYIILIINLFFGTFIGIILSINKKPKRRGFSK